MKSKDNNFDVNEYKIKFIYNDNATNIHERYFQSISLEQVQENLSKIIGMKQVGWKLLSIERYNRFNRKWESEI